jgi:hypothetical protein
MAGMWLDRRGLAASRKGLNMGNAMVSESQLAFLRSIDTPTVCNLIEIVAPERRGAGEPPALPVS